MATISAFLYIGCILAAPDEYDKTVRVRRRCDLMSNYFDHLLWPPYVIGGPLYVCPVVSIFYLLSFFPRLISAVGDWMITIGPTSAHGVALVRI